jgi:hypothetical protein
VAASGKRLWVSAVMTWAPWKAILKGIPARRFGTVNHVDAQMVVADGVRDPTTPTSHDSDGRESTLSPASLVEHQTDPV